MLDRLKAQGGLEVILASPAPANAACQLELALTDGEQLRSDSVMVPLP